MAKQVKAFTSKPGGLSFEAWNTHVEGENQCMHIIGWPPHMCDANGTSPHKKNIILETLKKNVEGIVFEW